MSDLVPKQSLVDLMAEAEHISQAILEAEGEVTPEIERMLDVNKEKLMAKADAYGHCLATLEANFDYWIEESERFYKVAQSFKQAKDRLKENMKACLLDHPDKRVEGLHRTFTLARTKPSLKVDETIVPDEYKISVVTMKIDKDKIRDDIMDGKVIQGAELIESYSLKTGIKRT